MRLIRLFGLVATLAASSQAAVIYDFSFVPAGGDFGSFTFQITAPTYLTGSSSLSVDPFTITGGGEDYTIVKGNVSLSGRCFSLGSQNGSVGDCSVTPAGIGNAVMSFTFSATITAPGDYSTDQIGILAVNGVPQNLLGYGDMNLTVTDDALADAPEPAQMGLFGTGLAGLATALRFRKRLSHNQ